MLASDELLLNMAAGVEATTFPVLTAGVVMPANGTIIGA